MHCRPMMRKKIMMSEIIDHLSIGESYLGIVVNVLFIVIKTIKHVCLSDRRGCSLEILNLTPKGVDLDVAQAFCDP